MKRKEITKDQLDQIIKLRERSVSWVKIQDATNVPRRVGQRCYEEWQQKQLWEQLSNVRHNIAEEDLREHRRLQVGLSDQLVSLMEISNIERPPLSSFSVSSEERLAVIWRTNRWVEEGGEGILVLTNTSISELEKRQIERKNHLLFQSLKTHTRGKVRWRALDEWKSNWDSCKLDLEELEKDIRLGVRETLTSLEDLKIINDKAGSVEVIDKIVEGLYRLMRQSLLAGLPGFSMDTSSGAQRAKVTGGPASHHNIKDLQIPVTDSKSLKLLCRILNATIEELYSGDRVGQIQNSLTKARKAALELEESLNPLVLNPLILVTRCDLCPV